MAVKASVGACLTATLTLCVAYAVLTSLLWKESLQTRRPDPVPTERNTHSPLTGTKQSTAAHSNTHSPLTGTKQSTAAHSNTHSPLTGAKQSTAAHSSKRCDPRDGFDPTLKNGTIKSSEILLQDKVFSARRDLYHKVCSRRSPSSGKDVVMMILPSHGLAICHSPKAGATFWKKMVRFLSGETSSQSPFLLSSYFAHNVRSKKTWMAGIGRKPQICQAAKNSVRAVFARDPYARMWSAYVDKFVLVDGWNFGQVIVQRRGNNSHYQVDKAGRACGSDVTFSEFLAWSPTEPNVHWLPISQICDPCLLQPHVIGHMETFARDSALLLQSAGLEKLAGEVRGGRQVARAEIMGLIDFHFTNQAKQKYSACLTPIRLAYRIWRVLQLNGHLPAQQPFPRAAVQQALAKSNTTPATVQAVFQLYHTAHLAANLTAAELRQHKRSFMLNAFAQVPMETLRALQKTFRLDFEMFGYDPEPKEIFSPSQRKVHGDHVVNSLTSNAEDDDLPQ